MFKIRKRSLPSPPMAAPPSILAGILRKSDSPKKSRRSVGFVDDIGKPLVEYRDLPPCEKIDDSNSHHYEPTSGKLISSGPSWNVIPVKTLKALRSGKSETGMIEEMRLEENNISREPLFGEFDVDDEPRLELEAYYRSRKAVPIIPLNDIYATPPRVDTSPIGVAPVIIPLHNTYEQVFEEPPPPPKTNVMALMAQLKQRGLISNDSTPVLPPVGLVVPPMLYQEVRRDQERPRTQRGPFKPPRMCTYYIQKADKCNKGNSCRFVHDDQLREHYQRERQPPMRNENWREMVASPQFNKS